MILWSEMMQAAARMGVGPEGSSIAPPYSGDIGLFSALAKCFSTASSARRCICLLYTSRCV